jgi:hypothetical protein
VNAKTPGREWLNSQARGIEVEKFAESSKKLAESWEKIEDIRLKEEVFKEIKSIYIKKGWWDNAPAKNTQKTIKNYYKAWENKKG